MKEGKRDHHVTWSLVSYGKKFQFYPKNNGGTIKNLLFHFKDLDLIIFDVKEVTLAGIRRMNFKWVGLEAERLSKK